MLLLAFTNAISSFVDVRYAISTMSVSKAKVKHANSLCLYPLPFSYDAHVPMTCGPFGFLSVFLSLP